MAVLKNRAKMSTSTTGTGTITLGSAESGYQTFGGAGVANADVVRYVIEDGTAWEIGTGTYTATGTTLTRTVSESSNADAAIVLTGSATVFIGATAEDIPALYADNESSPTAQPSATGTNAIAIGDSAVSTGSRTVAFSNSRAGGWDSIAGAILNNTTTYGTTSEGNIAFGEKAKVTGSASQSIGKLSLSSGAQSMSLGYDAQSSGLRTYAFGYGATASHTDSVAIGRSVSTTASNQVALGASTQTVRISEAYTLPIADGTASQVLTTDGAGAVTFATAGGGGASAISIDIKTADYTVVAGDLGKIIKYAGAGADRTVTLTAGATLGDGFYVTISNANTGADERVVIDPNGTEKFGWSTGPQTITLSRGEMVKIVWDNTNSCWIIGEGGFNLAIRNDINPANSVLVGDGTNAGFAAGYDAQATGSVSVALGRGVATGGTSVALGKGYASGADSFAAAIANNTSSYGAASTSSIAIGKQAKSTGAYGTAIGEATQATASNSVCMGYYSQATAQGAVAIGYDAQATAGKSYSFGLKVRNAIQNTFRFAGGHFSAAGDAQSGIYIMRSDTTDATAEALTTTKTAASTDNQVVLPDNSVYGFTGTIIARENSAQTNDFAVWEVKGGAVRATGVATTALGSYNINKISESTGAAAWAIAISADTTNGAIAFTVTGEAAHSIRWVATINTTEVTY